MRRRPARTRLADWPDRLAALLEQAQPRAFAWGTHDCATFAADAALAVTGSDPMAALRGRYTTEAEAEALLGGSLAEGAARVLGEWGALDVAPAFAMRGDLALLMIRNELVMGVVMGDRVFAPGPDRLAAAPARAIQRCWAV